MSPKQNSLLFGQLQVTFWWGFDGIAIALFLEFRSLVANYILGGCSVSYFIPLYFLCFS